MRLNFILFMADQLRKDCIGAYGNTYVNTPNLDRLAREGMVFERCYVANPICMPNRNSILSGRMPSNHGVWTNGICVPDCGKTLPHELKKSGYATASIGKLHLSPCGEQAKEVSFESRGSWDETPKENVYTGGYFGYDHVELTIGHTSMKAHYGKWFREQGGREEMLRTEHPEGDGETGIRQMPGRLCSSEYIGSRAEEYIRTYEGDQPFFLTVSFPDPHHPFTSCFDDYETYRDADYRQPVGGAEDLESRPSHYREFYRGEWTRQGGRKATTPDGISKEVEAARIRHTYAMVERIDKNVGKVLDAVKERNLEGNTVILFTSDHGELLGDHGLWKKGPFFYEGLINVPLLVKGPDIRPGRTEALCSSVDIAPTVCEMSGILVPDYMDGVSQRRVLEDGDPIRANCLIQYRNGYGKADRYASVLVRPGEKLAAYEDGIIEMTDLKKDQKEQINVAGIQEYRPLRCEMVEELLQELLKNKRKGDIQYGLS